MLGCFLLGAYWLGLPSGPWSIPFSASNRPNDVTDFFIDSALSGTVPVYISEISPPKTRGMIGGLSGVGLSIGTMAANWVGFAGGYAPYGDVQWRVPLGLQIPWGVIMFLSLTTFMPNSPRQLIQKGRPDQARKVFNKIWTELSSDEVAEEFRLMQAQIEYEETRRIPSYGEILRLYQRRVLVYVPLSEWSNGYSRLNHKMQVVICPSLD